MLTLGAGRRVFLVAGVTDMRKSFDGLSGVVRSAIAGDPKSGHVFLYLGGPGGLSPAVGFNQTLGGLGENEADDRYGEALAAGDFNGDGFGDPWPSSFGYQHSDVL